MPPYQMPARRTILETLHMQEPAREINLIPAQRDTVAKTILQRITQPTSTYPLAVALSDLEDYYRAGTMNTGLIEAAGDAANTQGHLEK